MEFCVALVFSGIAFLVGAVCASITNPSENYLGFYVAGAAFVVSPPAAILIFAAVGYVAQNRGDPLTAVPQPSQKGTGFPDRDPDLFYDLAKDRLSTQLDFIDAVDNKIGMLFSVSSALMGILVAVVAFKATGTKTGKVTTADWVLVGVSGGFYLLVAATTVFGYYGRQWGTGPKLEQVYKDSLKPTATLSDDLLKWQVAGDFVNDYRDNIPVQRTKEWCAAITLGAVIFQTGTLCAALALVGAGG